MKNKEQVDEKKTPKTNKKKLSSLIVKLMWGLFFLGILFLFTFFTLINKGAVGYLPPIENLQNPIDKYASQVISSDGEVLGTFSLSKDNRTYTDYAGLSPDIVHALIATEDKRYYEHSGIDFNSLVRAFFKTFILRQHGGGASTITQQLAKLLYSPKAGSIYDRLMQKPVEWVIAAKLERYYSKDEIICLYLNKYDFNYNAIGIRSAARTYFKKEPSELRTEEAAMLIGLCNNSSLYNPVRRPKLTQKRRDLVLNRMQDAGYLTSNQCDSLKRIPIKINFHRQSHFEGPAPYFRQYLAKIMMAKKPKESSYPSWMKQQFRDDSLSWETDPLYGWCYKNKKSNGEPYNIYTDGLKIYTTIDSKMQLYAEKSVEQHLGKYLQPIFNKEKKGKKYAPFSSAVHDDIENIMKRAMRQSERYRIWKKEGKSEREIIKAFKTIPVEMKLFSWNGDIDTTITPWDSIRYNKSILRAGFLAMDPKNGYVKAYVGGPNFEFFKYDMVNQGRRQIGSVVKPFLYTMAMESGMSPSDEMMHVPQYIVQESGRVWEPRNANKRRVGEMVTLKWGLQNSDNWVSAYLINQLSPYAFARKLKNFGLNGPIDPVVSLAVGSCDASVEEMTAAYTAFANKGIRTLPQCVVRIEDSMGSVITTFSPRMKEIIDEETCAKLVDMLRAVTDGGTARRMRYQYHIKGEMGSKTGTTQNNSDAWFISFTPQLVIGTWVGGEDRSVHFDSMIHGQGAAAALPIQGLFYQQLYKDTSLPYDENKKFDLIKIKPDDDIDLINEESQKMKESSLENKETDGRPKKDKSAESKIDGDFDD